MSAVDLRAVLADAAQSGAYFVDARDTQAMAEAGAALEFEVVRIDLAGCTDKTAALALFAQALRFPEWFGGNLDALADSLGDLSWLPADGYVLLIEHANEWRDAESAAFATLLEILNESAASWASLGVPFWALLPLPAAELAQMEPSA